jgi:hypothetical protein
LLALSLKANTKKAVLGEGDFCIFISNTLLIISKNSTTTISFYLLGNQIQQAENPAPCRPLWIQTGNREEAPRKAGEGKKSEKLTDYEQECPATPADKGHDKK